MAGGPILPHSALPVDSNLVFPMVYIGQGTVEDRTNMLGCNDATDLNANATWHLEFQMPEVLPTGTATLEILSRANAATGTLNVNPAWKSVAPGEDASTGALNAEGTTAITWSTGDADDYKSTTITLDADTVVAGEIIHMSLTFEDSGTTLATESGHIVKIIWV